MQIYRKLNVSARNLVKALLCMTPSVVAVLPLLADSFKYEACVSDRKEMGV